MLSAAFGECLDRRLIVFLAILTCGNFKSLAVVELNPNAILMDPAVSDFANAVRCHETQYSSLLSKSGSLAILAAILRASSRHRESHCGKAFDDDKFYCRYFIEPRSGLATDPGACEKVQGEISRVFWCRLWARADNK